MQKDKPGCADMAAEQKRVNPFLQIFFILHLTSIPADLKLPRRSHLPKTAALRIKFPIHEFWGYKL
jgi:hypothetical protein